MKVDGKTVGMLYSIGADCDMDDLMQAAGVNDFGALVERYGVAKTYAKLAAILNRWYCNANGGEPLTEKDFLLLRAAQLEELQRAVIKAMDEGRKQEIKTKPKNAKSVTQSN